MSHGTHSDGAQPDIAATMRDIAVVRFARHMTAAWLSVLLVVVVQIGTAFWYEGRLSQRVEDLEQEVRELRSAVISMRLR